MFTLRQYPMIMLVEHNSIRVYVFIFQSNVNFQIPVSSYTLLGLHHLIFSMAPQTTKSLPFGP
jgi:hypothetical protein